MGPKWPKVMVSFKFFFGWNFILLALWLHKSNIREDSDSWATHKNALSQWDCKILKSPVSQEKVDESIRFLAWWLVIQIQEV